MCLANCYLQTHSSALNWGDTVYLHPMCFAYCYLRAHLTALFNWGATQYFCIRCLLRLVICKPIWRRSSLRSYPIYLHPMCIAYCYCKPIWRRSEELPNIFASDVYCILLFASPFDDATHWGATQHICIQCVLHIVIASPLDGAPQLRRYPIYLHPMCIAYYL